MSWLSGALQTGAALVDIAGTVSNIVYQQRQASLLAKQNQLYAQWMHTNEQLQRDSMRMTSELATQGPAMRVQAALDAGFSTRDARRLAGSSEQYIKGYVDMPVMTMHEANGLQVYGNFSRVSQALSTFHSGTPFGKPQPPGFQTGRPRPQGFVNPNYVSAVQINGASTSVSHV